MGKIKIKFKIVELCKNWQLKLRPASEAELFAVLNQTRLVWGVGVSLEDYLEYHRLIRWHPWSRENFQHLILTDEKGQILSSCKTYFHKAKIKNDVVKLCGIGAVFTPPEFRQKGYATQMLSSLLDELKEKGFDLAMLFSDIGTDFYARLGFQLIEKKDPIYRFVNPLKISSQVEITEHLPKQIWSWYRSYSQKNDFALLRPDDYFQLLSERISWHKRYLGFRSQKVFILKEDKSYLWVDLSRWRLVVRDFACGGDEPDIALYRLLSFIHQRYPFQEIYGWLPKEFDGYRFLKLKEKRKRQKTLLMFCALTEKGRKIFELPPEEIQFWLADYF